MTTNMPPRMVEVIFFGDGNVVINYERDSERPAGMVGTPVIHGREPSA
jgi:hypothetical protein